MFSHRGILKNNNSNKNKFLNQNQKLNYGKQL